MERPGNYPTFAGWPLTRQGFSDPPADFRPSVYWFWGRDVDRDALLPRMEEMKAAGIPDFWIQTRLGYPMEDYLSDRFFSDYRYCLEHARKLGLKAGLYDEYNWITGHCAGKTVQGHDEFRERHLFWTEAPVTAATTELSISGIEMLLANGLKDAANWFYEGGRPVWGQWQLVRAFAYQPDAKGAIDPDTVVNLSTHAQFLSTGATGCRIVVDWTAPSPNYRIIAFAAAQNTTSRLIDYLNPDAIRRYVEVGYEPYWRELKEYFGNTLFAVFLDEPYAGFHNWTERTGEIVTSFMYNEEFYETFAADNGYDFRDYLYVLIHKAGEQHTARLRSEFYTAYSQRAINGFFRQLSDWAHAHGLPLCGHELCTSFNAHWSMTSTRTSFDSLSQFGADHWGIGELKDISTMDSGSYAHTIPAKMASSIAHTLGKNGTMLEQFTNYLYPGTSAAAGNWDLTFQTLKTKADSYMLQGLTKFLFHGFFQSNDVVGDNLALFSQRFDFPPGLNYEPWFRYYRKFTDYNGRLSYFLNQGTHVAKVAILYPLRTYWAEATQDIFVEETGFLNEHLARLHYDYDIIDERMIRCGEVRDGKLWVRDEGYSCVILPCVSTVQDVQTMEALQRFTASGGVVLATGRVPTKSQLNGLDLAVKAASEALFGAPGSHLIPRPLHKEADGLATLQQTIERLVPRAVAIRTGGAEDTNLFYCQRADAEATYVAVLNDEQADKLVDLTIAGAHGVPEIWDLETGTVREWRYFTTVPEGITVHLPMKPLETVAVRVPLAATPGPAVAAATLPVVQAEMAGGALSIRVRRTGDAGPGIVTLADGRRLEVEAVTVPAVLELGQDWQFQAGPGAAAVSLKSGLGWEQQGFPTYQGLGIYRQTVDLPASLAGFELELQAENVCHTLEVELNGVPCGIRPWAPFRVELPANAVKAGRNDLVIKVTNTAGNEFYHGTQYDRPKAPSGLCGRVRIVPHAVTTLRVEG